MVKTTNIHVDRIHIINLRSETHWWAFSIDILKNQLLHPSTRQRHQSIWKSVFFFLLRLQTNDQQEIHIFFSHNKAKCCDWIFKYSNIYLSFESTIVNYCELVINKYPVFVLLDTHKQPFPYIFHSPLHPHSEPAWIIPSNAI